MSNYEIDFNLELIGDMPDATKASADNSKPNTYRKDINEAVFSDEEDEMLDRIKSLMVESKKPVVKFFKNIVHNAHNVAVKQMALLVEGTPFTVMPLDNTKRQMYKPNFCVEHGDSYQFRIDFVLLAKMPVNLKYQQDVYRYGHPVNSNKYIIQTKNLPNKIVQSVYTTEEVATQDKLHDGIYTVKSLLTDIAMNKYMEWEWCFSIGPKTDEY